MSVKKIIALAVMLCVGCSAYAITMPSWITIKDKPVFDVRTYGAKGDGSTNDTPALQSAFDAAYASGGGVIYLPKGSYRITSNIVPQIASGNRGISVIGDGMEISRIVASNGSGLKFYGDTPPARTNAFVGVLLRDFGIVNTTTLSGIGLDIYSMQRSRIEGVMISGYEIGCKVRSSWNLSFTNRCQFIANKIGMKVPKSASGTGLNEGFNNVEISGINLGYNASAGASISIGTAISFRDCLFESSPVGVYLLQSCQKVTISNAYYEAGSIVEHEVRRDGASNSYLLYCGKDADGNIGSTSLPITDLVIDNCMEYFGESLVYLNNVQGVYAPYSGLSRGYFILGPDVSNVKLSAIGGDDRFCNILQDARTGASVNRVLRSMPYNLIPNGDFNLPNLPPYTITVNAGIGTPAVSLATATVGTITGNVMAIACPIGPTDFTVHIRAQLGKEFQKIDSNLVMAIRGHVTNGTDVSQISLSAADGSGNSITPLPASTNNPHEWFTLTTQGNPRNNMDSPVVVVNINIKRLTATDGAYISIDDIVLANAPDAGSLLSLSPIDLAGGFSGATVTSSIVDSTSFYHTGYLSSGGFQKGYFSVFISPTYNIGLATPTVSMVQYGTGLEDGYFRILSNAANCPYEYHIVPKVGWTP